jgi:hypothetical protein
MPHPWAVPIAKHKANIIMNLNICESQCAGGGGFFYLHLKSVKDLTPISWHNIPPTLNE